MGWGEEGCVERRDVWREGMCGEEGCVERRDG